MYLVSDSRPTSALSRPEVRPEAETLEAAEGNENSKQIWEHETHSLLGCQRPAVYQNAGASASLERFGMETLDLRSVGLCVEAT